MEELAINQHVQDCYLFLATTDTNFLKLTREFVPTNYFSSEVTETLVKCCYEYYDQFKEAPVDHLYDEMIRKTSGKESSEIRRYEKYLGKIASMEQPNKEYILHRISDFVKAREFEGGALQFVKLTEKGKFIEAKELMFDILKHGIEKEDVGLEFFESESPTYLDNDNYNFLVSTGVPELDNLIGGYKRGEFVCIVGGYKGKKSWSLINTGTRALYSGLNVLHVSHEMKVDEIEMRYDMSIGGLTSDPTIKEVDIDEVDEYGHISKTYTHKVKNVYDKEVVLDIRKKVKKMGGKLIIKKYPMGTCTTNELIRYLDYLETYHGFIPDIVLNDYADIMMMPYSSSNRDSINKIYIDHKKIADERNLLILTVSQVNREGLSKENLTLKELAEDARKAGNVDVMVAFSQTDEQEKDNIMRAKVLATRSRGGMNCSCMLKQNLVIGQFCTDSWMPPVTDDHTDF